MTDKEISIFCNNVKLLREQNGLTGDEMAEICGIGVTELIQIEHGNVPKNITVDAVIRLFQYFDVSPEKLFREL